MALLVTNGAMCMCSCGTCPSPLLCPPTKMVTASKISMAVITDNVPGMNITTFGTCMLKLVMGVPMPCTYAPAGTWLPMHPAIQIKGLPALTNDSMLMCTSGGMIKIIAPGQFMMTGK